MVKGREVIEPETLAQMDVPGHETAVEVPTRLMAVLVEAPAWTG